MIVDLVLRCDCNPDKVYKTRKTYENHFKSMKHKKWEEEKLLKNYKKSSTEYENLIGSYKLKNERLLIENNRLSNMVNKKVDIIEFYLKNFIIIQIILLIKYSN